MGLPDDPEVRRFYRAGFQRLEDAQILEKWDRTSGAVYLAGYAVECMLKALLLSAVPTRMRSETVTEFRSKDGHNFEWLKGRYRASGGSAFPAEIAKSFSFVKTWSTALRYDPKIAGRREAAAFLEAVERIVLWADGRL